MSDADERLTMRLEYLTNKMLHDKYDDYYAEELLFEADQTSNFIATHALVSVCLKRIHRAIREDNAEEERSFQAILPFVSQVHQTSIHQLFNTNEVLQTHELIDESA
jgi:hypothetical protein